MSKRNLSLVMTFKNDEGKDTTLTLNDIKEDLSEEVIEKAMDEIIKANVINSEGADLVAKVKAQIVDKNVSVFEMA